MTHRRVTPSILAALLIASAATSPPAFAWGDEGHEIVALLAYSRLLPAVRKKVDAILAADKDTLTPPDFASRATWADRYRDSDRSTTQVRYLGTRAWHFADIEVEGGSVGAACPSHPPPHLASQGPADDCVVRKVDQFSAELAASTTPVAEKRLALKFLLHFVGDVHQPLHSADHDDAGGNRVPVLYPGISTATNLHAYWDTRLVRLLGTNLHLVADGIGRSLSPADAASWARGSPALWAVESNQQARSIAYQYADQPTRIDSGGVRAVDLSGTYDARALPIVRQQLAKAGVRLAFTLNQALR